MSDVLLLLLSSNGFNENGSMSTSNDELPAGGLGWNDGVLLFLWPGCCCGPC